MIRSLALLALAVTLVGCATEKRVIRDNSANAKFAALFGGSAATSDGVSSGWAVSGGNASKSNQPSGPVSPTALKIAELLRNQANAPRPAIQDHNPGNWKVTTSFPTDGEQGQPADPSAPQNSATVNPPADPFGVAPATPSLPGSLLPAVPTQTPSR